MIKNDSRKYYNNNFIIRNMVLFKSRKGRLGYRLNRKGEYGIIRSKRTTSRG